METGPPPPPGKAWVDGWRTVFLVPEGLLRGVEVFALQQQVGMMHTVTNDIVLVHDGVPHVLEHEGCEPLVGPWARHYPHRARVERPDPPPPGDRRRLRRVPVIVAPELPVSVKLGELVPRPGEPLPVREGRRLDLDTALLPEVARLVGSGDPWSIGSLVALLDLLTRFDGHEVGEVELLAPQSAWGRDGNVSVGIGARGVALLDGRVDEETRARISDALGDGRVVPDGQGGGRLRAIVAKRERLNASSGHRARLCLATLTLSPGGFVYDDEVLWSELDPGNEYS